MDCFNAKNRDCSDSGDVSSRGMNVFCMALQDAVVLGCVSLVLLLLRFELPNRNWIYSGSDVEDSTRESGDMNVLFGIL